MGGAAGSGTDQQVVSEAVGNVPIPKGCVPLRPRGRVLGERGGGR